MKIFLKQIHKSQSTQSCNNGELPLLPAFPLNTVVKLLLHVLLRALLSNAVYASVCVHLLNTPRHP